MVSSMTGYGKCTEILNGREITLEIKSVNHRFFEFSSRMPRAYGFLEEKIKSYVQSRVSRGKIEVGVSIVNVETADTKISVNETVAKGYVDALRELCEPLGIADDIRLSTVARFPDVFTVTKGDTDEEMLWGDVKSVAEKAVDAFIAMREREGENLKKDLLCRLENIEELVKEVEKRSPKRVQEYRDRLYKKISEVLASNSIDESRIITEVAIFADKVAVDEETVRLKSHIGQFREILEYNEPIGKKLDFLIQEFNREANTIGSKSQDAEGAKYVVAIKAEIEKIREQIQNVE
ncbi:MAG: YicC family protein [Ruminococcaceae bacterium]|nr:YicC family protein [Oscillospiraceae bacterium]